VNAREWSVRTWSMPWIAAATGALQVALASPSIVPGLVAVVLLAWIPFRRSAWAPSGALPWGMGIPFAIWWAALAVGGRAGPIELAGVVSWYLILLALLQTLRGSAAGSWRCWNSLAAALLVGFRPNGLLVAILLVQCLAILAHLRLEVSRSGASRMRPSWSGGIALAAVVSTIPLWIRLELPSGAFEAIRSETARKGFSSRLKLGEGFLFEGDPSDGDIVLRIWADQPPDHFKGAVFDTYRRGAWSRSEAWTSPTSSRNEQEFSVFCQVSDTLEPALGWARSEVATDGYLLVPSGAGCAGVVADSVRMVGSGVWNLGGPGLERGWMWFAGETPRRVLVAERDVPPELADLLDSIGAEAGIRSGLSTDSVAARIERWFAGHFRYSLRVSDPEDLDPLRVFLSERRGFCEHFATAGALLARSAGIPSRVVTGYAYPSPLAGGWVARRANAHAWVELHDSAGGWRTWDPTPASDPAIAARGWWVGQVEGWAMRASRWWHVLRDGRWRADLERLVEGALGRVRGTAGFGIALLVVAAGSWWLWRSRLAVVREKDDRHGAWRRRARRAEDLLRRAGWVRIPGETFGEFLGRLPPEAPASAKRDLESYQANRWKDG
jgi:hypothetical protein